MWLRMLPLRREGDVKEKWSFSCPVCHVTIADLDGGHA
jgi:hypothetical protein